MYIANVSSSHYKRTSAHLALIATLYRIIVSGNTTTFNAHQIYIKYFFDDYSCVIRCNWTPEKVERNSVIYNKLAKFFIQTYSNLTVAVDTNVCMFCKWHIKPNRLKQYANTDINSRTKLFVLSFKSSTTRLHVVKQRSKWGCNIKCMYEHNMICKYTLHHLLHVLFIKIT